MSDEITQSPDNSQGSETTTTEETTTEGSVTSYLDGKYSSVSALEDGYKELQSTFSKKTAEYNEGLGAFTGSPETYELSEGLEVSESMLEFAKENNFSNEALNNMVTTYNDDIKSQREAFTAQQKEALGTNADARLTNVQDWAKANLGEDAMDTFGGMITTAKSVELVEKIMKLQSGTTPAPAKPSQSVDRDSVKSMRFAKDEFGGRRMSSDPQYRSKVEAMEADFIANGGKL